MIGERSGRRSRWQGRLWWAGAAVTGGALAGAGAAALAAVLARRVVVPDHRRPDDVDVLAVDLAVDPPAVTLRRTDDTVLPGRYGLWWDERAGHARLGEVLRQDATSVVRRVVRVEAGSLTPGPARWNQYYLAGPPSVSLGLTHQDVEIDSDVGPLPAWLIPPDPTTSDGDGDGVPWAVLVHGRGGTREECLRAVPPLHALGLPVLVPGYRNDVDAPPDPSGRYRLGEAEWRDVEAAMAWAQARGARRFVLVGWSMGGAIVLQTAARSQLRQRVAALVLDAPVIDWQDVLAHHTRVNRLPSLVGRLAGRLVRHRVGGRLAGLPTPLDLRDLDWVTRSRELQVPTLLIHSDGDEFVPNGPSLALARARPDLVRLVPWRHGRHTKEWNTDPERWEAEVSAFVAERLAVRDAPTG